MYSSTLIQIKPSLPPPPRGVTLREDEILLKSVGDQLELKTSLKFLAHLSSHYKSVHYRAAKVRKRLGVRSP